MLHYNCHTGISDWSGCTRCILSNTRRRVAIRRDGLHRLTTLGQCHILFIGEAPGETENVTGSPFTGTSGRILDAILEYVYVPFRYTITNTVGCQPCDLLYHAEDDSDEITYTITNKNREPTAKEIELCSPHIQELITFLSPRGLVLLGKVAVTESRLPTLRLLHPAAIARMEYKLLSIKKTARQLNLFLEQVVAASHTY